MSLPSFENTESYADLEASRSAFEAEKSANGMTALAKSLCAATAKLLKQCVAQAGY
jgi:hypothetical protein